MPVKPRSNSGDAPETASDILLDEAAHFAAEGVWDLFGAKSDILGVRFPEDSEPWYTVFTGPGDGVEIHEIEGAVGGWLLLRGATGLRVAESIVHGVDLAGDRPSSPLEFLALGMVPAANVSDEDADFAAEDLDVATTEFPVFRVREAGERLSSRPDATDQSRIARALSALRRACAAGDLPPLAWTDASAVPFVATLAADEPDGEIADEHAEFPPAPVSWERPRGDHVHAVSVPAGVAELPASDAAWVAAFRVDTLGGAAAAEPTSSSTTADDDATPRPTADLFIVNVAGGPAIVADPSASVSPYALVRRVLRAIVAAGSRPASIAFEGHAAFAVAEATLRPLGIAVTESAPHAAIDPLATAAGARRRELDAIYNGEIVPRDDDGDGWDLVHLRAFEAIDDRLESEQKSISESFREYFGVRDDALNPQVEELATDAFQEWRALRLNPSGDRRSPIDRILKSDEIGPADRVFLEALRGAKLSLWRVETTDPNRRFGEVGPLRVADDETGYTLDVRVSRISHVPCEGDRVAGRVIKVGTCRILTQASPLLIAGDLESAREHLQRFGGDLTAKSMNSRPNLLGRLWEWALGSDDDEAGPPPPEEPPFDR